MKSEKEQKNLIEKKEENKKPEEKKLDLKTLESISGGKSIGDFRR